MRPLYPIVHFGNTDLLDGPRGPAEELALVLAHFPEEWRAYEGVLQASKQDLVDGVTLINDLLSAWDQAPLPPEGPHPTREEVSDLFDRILPVVRRGLRTLDSELTDHILWAGQDGLRRSLMHATRYVHETGRAVLLS